MVNKHIKDILPHLIVIGVITIFSFGGYMFYSFLENNKSLKDIVKTPTKNLIKELNTDNEMLFEQNVYQIERLGVAAVPDLKEVLRDKRSSRQEVTNVIYVLGRLGDKGALAVENILPHLKDKSADRRAVSVIALGKIGKGSSVHFIVDLLYDEDKWVRESTVTALKRINNQTARKALKEYKLAKLKQQTEEPADTTN